MRVGRSIAMDASFTMLATRNALIFLQLTVVRGKPGKLQFIHKLIFCLQLWNLSSRGGNILNSAKKTNGNYCFRKKALYSRKVVKITVQRSVIPIWDYPWMGFLPLQNLKLQNLKLQNLKLQILKCRSPVNFVSRLHFFNLHTTSFLCS